MSNSDIAGPDLGSEGGRHAAPARPYWLGLAIIAIGFVWLYGAFSLPQTAQYARIGPGLFVTLIGASLVVLGGLLMMQIAQGEQFSSQDSEDAEAGAPADRRALLLAAAAAALPLLVMPYLGFPLTATLSFALVARAFGSPRPAMDLLIGLALSLIAYFAFAWLGVTLGGFLPLLTGR